MMPIPELGGRPRWAGALQSPFSRCENHGPARHSKSDFDMKQVNLEMTRINYESSPLNCVCSGKILKKISPYFTDQVVGKSREFSFETWARHGDGESHFTIARGGISQRNTKRTVGGLEIARKLRQRYRQRATKNYSESNIKNHSESNIPTKHKIKAN